MRDQILSFLAGALIVFLALGLRDCGSHKLIDLPVPRMVSQVDTIIKSDTITKIKLVYLLKHDTVTRRELIPVYRNIETGYTVYVDSVSLDSSRVFIGYTAYTIGSLDSITLRVRHQAVTREVEKTITKETTIRQFPAGLFLGASISSNKFAPTATLISKKHKISVGYDLVNKRTEIGYGFRVTN